MFATIMTAMLTIEEQLPGFVVTGEALKNAEHIASSTGNCCSEQIKERINGDNLLNTKSKEGGVTGLRWFQ